MIDWAKERADLTATYRKVFQRDLPKLDADFTDKEILDFDETQLDSAVAKAERLKKLLTECHELIKGLPNPPPQEMTFDEFVKRLSNYIVEASKTGLTAKLA